MVKVRTPPRGTGPYGNGARPPDTLALSAAGLALVRHMDDHGHAVGETVIPEDEIPQVCIAQQQCPTERCRACHVTAWRLDRGTKTSWVCGRCYP